MEPLRFQPLTMQDRSWAQPLLMQQHARICEYQFGTLFLWKEVYNTLVAACGGYLVALSDLDKKTFLFPTGEGDLAPVLLEMERYVNDLGQPLVLNNVSEQDANQADSLFPGKFTIEPTRDAFDYIYEADKLASLSGKKLHAKRNHVNHFLTEYSGRWGYEPITEQNLAECEQMNLAWCRENGLCSDDGLQHEQDAIAKAFQYFFALGLQGGLIRVDGSVAAFCMGEPLTKDTFVVHFEKALSQYQTGYTMINQQFVQQACQGYRYINREDDVGDEGLRKAKLSYHPAFLEQKFLLTAN